MYGYAIGASEKYNSYSGNTRYHVSVIVDGSGPDHDLHVLNTADGRVALAHIDSLVRQGYALSRYSEQLVARWRQIWK